jgi:thiol-disulfide isomerase/thioredoxin
MANKDEYKFLFFQGNDCGLCQGMKIKAQRELKDYGIDFEYINLEDNPKLRGQYSVFSFPTLLLVKNDKEIDRVSGFFDLDKMKRVLDVILG